MIILTDVGSDEEEFEFDDPEVVLELEDIFEVHDLEEVRPLLVDMKLSADVRLIVSGHKIGGDLDEELIGIWT